MVGREEGVALGAMVAVEFGTGVVVGLSGWVEVGRTGAGVEVGRGVRVSPGRAVAVG